MRHFVIFLSLALGSFVSSCQPKAVVATATHREVVGEAEVVPGHYGDLVEATSAISPGELVSRLSNSGTYQGKIMGIIDELIKEGQVKGVWDFRTDDVVSAEPKADAPPAPPTTPAETKPLPAPQPSVDTPTQIEKPRAVKKKIEKVEEVDKPSIKAQKAKEQVNVQLH